MSLSFRRRELLSDTATSLFLRLFNVTAASAVAAADAATAQLNGNSQWRGHWLAGC